MAQKYTIEDFLKIKFTGNAHFTADDSEMVYVSDLTGTLQLYIMSADGSNQRQLTDFPDAVSDFRVSPTQNIVAFSKSKGGSENDQIFLLNLDSKEVTHLTDDDKVQYNLGGWSWDGKFISYSSNERNGKDVDVYILDMDTKKTRCVFDLGGRCHPVGFSPRDRYLTIQKIHGAGDNDTYLYNLSNDSIEYLTEHEEKAVHGTPRWLPDESAFFFMTNRGREFKGLARFEMEARGFEYVLTPDWDVDGLVIDRQGKHLSVIVNEEGYSNVTMYDPYTLKPLLCNFPKGEIFSIRFSHDSTRMVFNLMNSTKAADIWVMDMDSGKCEQLTHSPQGVPPDVLVEPELIRFESFDGLSVPAFIYKPKNSVSNKPLPTIINIHGGPESQYTSGFNPLTQYFVHAGYAVVAPNVRGSSGYGKTYMALDDKEKRLDSVKDIVALREYLETVPYIDENNIALMGGSYGGFMVLANLAFYPDLWVAGVDIVGIVNFTTFLENTAPYRRALREAEYGSLEKDKELLEKISPINSVDNIKAPLLVIHGANDPRVPLSEAQQLVARLEELGRKTELIVYEDEGHGLAKLKNKLDAYPKVADFLARVFEK